MDWAGIALQKEDQLGRKSLGRNWKEKKEFPGVSHELLTLLSVGCGSSGSLDLLRSPPCTHGSWGVWVGFTSQLFLLQCQGNFLHPGMFFCPFPRGSPGSARAQSWDGLSPPQPSTTSSQAANSTGNNFSTLCPSFFPWKIVFFSGSDPPHPPEHIPIPKAWGQQHLWGLFSFPGPRVLH